MAFALSVASVMLAAWGAASQREFHFTDFWMVRSATLPSLAVIGVRNEEARSVNYEIEIVSRGALSDRLPPITLAPGQTHLWSIAVPTVVFAQAAGMSKPSEERQMDEMSPSETDLLRVEARLFKDQDRGTIYRRVWLAVSSPLKPGMSSENGPISARSKVETESTETQQLPLERNELVTSEHAVGVLREPSPSMQSRTTSRRSE